jgi:F420-dependent oxidoreductase-like protein
MTAAASPKVSVRLRYSPSAQTVALARAADELGFYGVWVSEPWGFDAGAVLGAIAAQTRNVVLGTHVASVYARTPAATAGLAAALATISDGRFRLGLGTSGRQVVEGWHGVAFRRPSDHLRGTVSFVRAVLRGERAPIESDHALRFSQLEGALDVPIYLAALGPRNQRLAAEVADGWTPTPYSPDAHALVASEFLASTREWGRQDRVKIAPVCPVAVGGDVERLFDLERGWSALYLGGMGEPVDNHYAQFARRMGWAQMVDDVQSCWRRGDRRGAKHAVRDEYVDSIGLFGSAERIRDRLQRYQSAGVDEVVLELRKLDVVDQLDDLRHLAKGLAA